MAAGAAGSAAAVAAATAHCPPPLSEPLPPHDAGGVGWGWAPQRMHREWGPHVPMHGNGGMPETDKRRRDRNDREQKRSKRISDQIKELKDLLEESGLSTSKGNKSSVLTCAADFILDLQRQNQDLARAVASRQQQHMEALAAQTAQQEQHHAALAQARQQQQDAESAAAAAGGNGGNGSNGAGGASSAPNRVGGSLTSGSDGGGDGSGGEGSSGGGQSPGQSNDSGDAASGGSEDGDGSDEGGVVSSNGSGGSSNSSLSSSALAAADGNGGLHGGSSGMAGAPTLAAVVGSSSSSHSGGSSSHGSNSSSGRHHSSSGSHGRNIHNGVNFRRVFYAQVVPMALTAVDGSFLDCNWRFERVSGYAKADLLRMNFFTMARPAQRDANIFHLVAEMLRGAPQVEGGTGGQCVVRAALHPDRSRGDGSPTDAYLHLSTVPERSSSSGPGAAGDVKFFTCALLPSPCSL